MVDPQLLSTQFRCLVGWQVPMLSPTYQLAVGTLSFSRLQHFVPVEIPNQLGPRDSVPIQHQAVDMLMSDIVSSNIMLLQAPDDVSNVRRAHVYSFGFAIPPYLLDRPGEGSLGGDRSHSRNFFEN